VAHRCDHDRIRGLELGRRAPAEHDREIAQRPRGRRFADHREQGRR
jgi:hypothetical protein